MPESSVEAAKPLMQVLVITEWEVQALFSFVDSYLCVQGIALSGSRPIAEARGTIAHRGQSASQARPLGHGWRTPSLLCLDIHTSVRVLLTLTLKAKLLTQP